jgi:cytochrome c553
MRTRIVSGVLAALFVLAAPANTAEVAPGADLTTEREFIAKMGMCNQCHGANGMPVRPGIPIIWGQQQDFLVKQIHDFESGTRNNELMTWAAKTLHEPERAPAAGFFSKKAWPARTSAAAAATPRPGGMAVCEACHQLNFAGGLLVPRLAGQNYEYLVESMRRFADGERTNNPEMSTMMKALTPPQREAMARYLANL